MAGWRNGSELWSVVGETDSGSSVAVADVAGDAVPEVLVVALDDYREVLALASSHRAGALDFDALTRAVVARGLPPHPLGDADLMIPVPPPPPGTPFDPKQMPEDWEGTWGEVAMACWLGALTHEEYDRLHRAAHPACGQR